MVPSVSGRLGALVVGILEILIAAVFIAAWIYNEVVFYQQRNSKGIPKDIILMYTYSAIFLGGITVTSLFLIFAALDCVSSLKMKIVLCSKWLLLRLTSIAYTIYCFSSALYVYWTPRNPYLMGGFVTEIICCLVVSWYIRCLWKTIKSGREPVSSNKIEDALNCNRNLIGSQATLEKPGTHTIQLEPVKVD